MNFDELDADIQSLEKTAKDFTITNQQEYESGQRFSQQCSHITIWLNKLLATLAESNKTVVAKMAAYEKKPAATNPNACVACAGTGKSSKGIQCKPCNGTGKKTSMPKPETKPEAHSPEPPSSKAVPPASAPSISLDDFDEAPLSEEDELTIELQKTLF